MSEFDQYSKEYESLVENSVGFSNLSHSFFTTMKADLLIELVDLHNGSSEAKILDLGCGIGLTDFHLKKTFKNLTGVDVSSKSIQMAKEHNPEVQYFEYSGQKLPFEDESFDFVFTINVMHHVNPDNWIPFLEEAKRVLKNGGKLIVFEHNPYNPLTLKAVKDCPFDEDAVLLKKGLLKNLFNSVNLTTIQSRYILFFPLKGKFFRKIEKLLAKLPLGAQYFCVAQK